MSTDPDLSPAEIQQAYADRFAQLTPPQPPDRAPGQRPRVMLLGGQPAAGKTTTQRLVHAALGETRVASYDGDDNAAVHPRYDAIRRAGGIAGHDAASKALPEDLHQRSLDHLRAGDPKYDVVASHPLTREEWTRAWVDGFSQQDYRVSVAYIATNDANSLLGLAERYQNARDNEGGGRWLDPDLHDTFYQEMPATADVLESEGLVDDIYVVDRDGYVLYENHRDADGSWQREPAVGQAIQEARDRPPLPEAHEYFERTADRLLNGRDPSLPPLEDKVRETVEDAVRREQARPAPETTGRTPDQANRIDQRLSGQTQAGTPGQETVIAGGPSGPPAGVDAAAWNAQRLATAGVAPAGSAPSQRAGSAAPAQPRSTSGPTRDSAAER